MIILIAELHTRAKLCRHKNYWRNISNEEEENYENGSNI